MPDINHRMPAEPTPPKTAAADHIPVLTPQVLALLQPRPGQVCLDCTVGRAGHAAAIIPRLAPGGRYIGLDVDPANIAYAQERLASAPICIDLVQANFATAPQVLRQLGVNRVDLLLADLGFSSAQMADPTRGLSFAAEGPLDMRLDPTLTTTAADLVNRLPEPELADLIYRFGEERLSRKIARKIAETRRRYPITTTAALAELIRQAYGSRGRHAGPRHRIDPATRTFMALRIAVNDELGSLQRLLDALPQLLRPSGVAVVISFHSLEDRLVKHSFARFHRARCAERLTPKPLRADPAERQANPRSRSAKLRAIRWLEGPTNTG